ncbi:MAG: hypothetical protein ACM3RX_05370 [Methanococcaceae archaeon]
MRNYSPALTKALFRLLLACCRDFQKDFLFLIRVNPVAVSSKHQYIIRLKTTYNSIDSVSIKGWEVDGSHPPPDRSDLSDLSRRGLPDFFKYVNFSISIKVKDNLFQSVYLHLNT